MICLSTIAFNWIPDLSALECFFRPLDIFLHITILEALIEFTFQIETGLRMDGRTCFAVCRSGK